MDKIMMTKNEIKSAVEKYLDMMSNSNNFSEDELNAEAWKLDGYAPNARISDMIYHYDRERTAEEMAEEALLREQVYVEGGKLALEEHLKKIYSVVFGRPDAPLHSLISATQILEGIEGHPLPDLRDYVKKKHQELFLQTS